ncbi:MAG: universal stress protein [Anaerolineae bacterium UTCFX2]|jgi:nucleotide-binding universal stress UspA family protein|nr:universal stress protein [Anaerolineae bacterium]OQY94647.1 MAG: universal stress protein [Anaerolineae bacterium UTCFX2]
MFNNILLAVDGSEHSMRAAKLAGDMARKFGSTVLVVVCYDPIPSYLGEPNLQEALNERLKQTAEIIAPALAAVGEIPGELKKDILEGPPAEAILSVIQARTIDLIVMGTRGRSQLTGLLLGSVSQKVVMYATCPVMLVR